MTWHCCERHQQLPSFLEADFQPPECPRPTAEGFRDLALGRPVSCCGRWSRRVGEVVVPQTVVSVGDAVDVDWGGGLRGLPARGRYWSEQVQMSPVAGVGSGPVVAGSGEEEEVVPTSICWNNSLKVCAVVLLLVALAEAAYVAFRNSPLASTADSAKRLPASEGESTSPQPQHDFNCGLPETLGEVSSVQSLVQDSAASVGAAAVVSAWRSADRDLDKRVSMKELEEMGLTHQLHAHALALLRAGDTDKDGALNGEEFASALTKDELVVRLARNSIMEGVEVNVPSSARGAVIPLVFWSDAQKSWCCANKHIGCPHKAARGAGLV